MHNSTAISVAGRAPSAGLIASLNARVWLTAEPGRPLFAELLLTHPPARGDRDTPAAIEQRMRTVAEALGLADPVHLVPDTGQRITIGPHGPVVLHFDGTPYAKRLPFNRHWTTTLINLGRVLLVVGLDPLPIGSDGQAATEYVRHGAASRRVLCGSADVVPVGASAHC